MRYDNFANLPQVARDISELQRNPGNGIARSSRAAGRLFEDLSRLQYISWGILVNYSGFLASSAFSSATHYSTVSVMTATTVAVEEVMKDRAYAERRAFKDSVASIIQSPER